jgi:hypothetical protein
VKNPWLKRSEERGTTGHGTVSENRVAKKLGAKTTPASGAKHGAKGDCRRDSVIIEAKSTTKDTLSLELAWLVKIGCEARNIGKVPALHASFVMPDGKSRAYGDWFVIPGHLAEEFFKFLGSE